MSDRDSAELADTDAETWLEPGSPELFRAIRATWEAERPVPMRFPPGVYKHRSIEEAQTLREQWEAECFAEFQAWYEVETRRNENR